MKMIEAHNLTKDYGNHRGIFDLSFTVDQGEVVGFLGSNGAGKTTTIRHLMGFIHPQQGISKVFDMDTFSAAKQIQSKVGYLPGEISFLNDRMTGNEFIRFMMEIKENVSAEQVRHLVDYFELDTRIKIKKMSKGTKQKLGLVVAFMHNPSVLILDEPTSGLDFRHMEEVAKVLGKLQKAGKTLFIITHDPELIERCCDYFIFIENGEVSWHGGWNLQNKQQLELFFGPQRKRR